MGGFRYAIGRENPYFKPLSSISLPLHWSRAGQFTALKIGPDWQAGAKSARMRKNRDPLPSRVFAKNDPLPTQQ